MLEIVGIWVKSDGHLRWNYKVMCVEQREIYKVKLSFRGLNGCGI